MMKSNARENSNIIRAKFSAAMSAMYRHEVPAYGDLISIVESVNDDVLSKIGAAGLGLDTQEDVRRISQERHGAIRLGTAQELIYIKRIFAVMGMFPVGYYDLGQAGIPVHSTAFRPIEREALAENPFRVFTSLLRTELIKNKAIRIQAEEILSTRKIYTDRALELVHIAEKKGGLDEAQSNEFVLQVLETFRWHKHARVDLATYQNLHDEHRLIADVVSFANPHINHLTPRTLDIDAAQHGMEKSNISAKAVVEGPPKRQCPILLRQTSFKALEEKVIFADVNDAKTGNVETGTHTARFGEIEQRGVALTPIGRKLYDELLLETRAKVTPSADGSNATLYQQTLIDVFKQFPDTWRELHDQKLGYFRYRKTSKYDNEDLSDLIALLDSGKVTINPIIYEDFLPVSAAGIFQSNLGDEEGEVTLKASSRDEFVEALGCEPNDEFQLYEGIQKRSLNSLFNQ